MAQRVRKNKKKQLTREQIAKKEKQAIEKLIRRASRGKKSRVFSSNSYLTLAVKILIIIAVVIVAIAAVIAVVTMPVGDIPSVAPP